MSPAAEIYRRAIIRAVTGRPGALHTEFDATLLADICDHLVRAWRVAELLKAHGLNRLPIDEAVALLLERETP